MKLDQVALPGDLAEHIEALLEDPGLWDRVRKAASYSDEFMEKVLACAQVSPHRMARLAEALQGVDDGPIRRAATAVAEVAGARVTSASPARTDPEPGGRDPEDRWTVDLEDWLIARAR